MNNDEWDDINEKGRYEKRAIIERNKRIDDIIALLGDADITRSEAAATASAIDLDTLSRVYFYPEAATFGRNAHVGHRKRLRDSALKDEKLRAFSDVELVELILSFMIPRKDTNMLAHRLLDKYGSVLGVMAAPKRELVKFPSMTSNAAEFIRMLPLVGQLKHRRIDLTITGGNDIVNHLSSLRVEKGETAVLIMDGNYRLVSDDIILSKYIPVDGIVSAACRHSARHVFVCRRMSVHDRPAEEVEVQKLEKLLHVIGAALLDYMQVNPAGYGSRELDRSTDPSGRVWQYEPSQTLSPSPGLIAKLWADDDE